MPTRESDGISLGSSTRDVHPVLLIASSLFLLFVDQSEGQLVASAPKHLTLILDVLSRRIANLGKAILHCQRHAVAFVMRFHSFVPSFPRAWEISAMTFQRLSDSVVWQNPLRSLYFLFGHRNEGQTSKVCPSKSSDSTERITKRERERRKRKRNERKEL